MKYKTGISTTCQCRLCQKTVTIKYNFLTDKEVNNIANLMMIPHFWKEHRKELFTFKRIKNLIKSFLFLLFFVPVHLVILILFFSLYPFYWLLEKLYS